EDWLDSLELDPHTMATYRGQAEKWIYPRIGRTKLKDFKATDADRLFREVAKILSKASLAKIKSTLVRSIRRAQKYDLIGRTGDATAPNPERPLALPKPAIAALQAHRKRQAAERLAAGATWQDSNLVFCHEDGRMYTSDALNWRFGRMTRRAGIGHWHAHEGRHTAVSIMSSNGVPLQEISDTVGHKSTHVTETVYRHVIVPAIRGGATVMDQVFGQTDDGD